MLRFLVALAVVFATRTARADEDYRGEMVIVDGAGLTAIGIGIALHHNGQPGLGTGLAIAGALTAGIAPAIIHDHHGHEDRAGLSVALRFGAPGVVAAGFLGYYTACFIDDVAANKLGRTRKDCVGGHVAWTAIGLTYLAGAVIDYAVTRPTHTPRMLSLSIKI
jgi:hypothetical protein